MTANSAPPDSTIIGPAHWLDTAMRLRYPGLEELKTDPLMDPLRKEPRFQVVMCVLGFTTGQSGKTRSSRFETASL